MSLTNYSDLSTAIASWTKRADLTSTNYSDFTTLFEAFANRRLRTLNQETTTILVPNAPVALAITGAANNGSGLIRLTLASTATLATGNIGAVSSVGGTTEANGSWVITVISGTTIDLQGSTFTNAYVSGGSFQLTAGQCSLPTDFMQWRRVTWTGNTRKELEFVHPSILQAYYPTDPSATPALFTIEGNLLKVRPIDGTPLEFDYWAKLPTLVSNSTNWLMTNWPDCYLAGALTEAFKFTKDPDNTALWTAARDQLIDEINKSDNKTGAPGAIRVMGYTP